MKILICGYGGHGKDTVADYIQTKYNLNHTSSSMWCLDKFIFNITKDLLGYKTREECFEDRRNHRALWYELISAYNYYDKSKIMKEIIAEYDMYVGSRSLEEIKASHHLFDLLIWVDASARLPIESNKSCTITKDLFLQLPNSYLLDNNLTLDDLYGNIDSIITNARNNNTR